MKLVYIENVRLPTEKAHGNQIMKTCDALARQGVDVTLIVPERVNPITKTPWEYYGMAPSFTIVRLPVTDFVLNVPSWLEKAAFLLERWTFLQQVKQALKKPSVQADAFFTRDIHIAATVRKQKTTPIFVELHGEPSEKTMRKLCVATGVINVTQWMTDRSKTFCPNVPCRTIRNGVDVARFDPSESRAEARKKLGLDPDARYVVYGGRFTTMESSKGLGELDRVVGRLAGEDPRLRLLLVGGSDADFLKAEGVRPSPSTQCIPSVPHETLALYYRAADMLIMSFPNTPHYAHKMAPIKMFEYMASRTPIMSSDLPSVREVLDEGSCFFFPADDQIALKDAIHAFFETPEPERMRRADRARGLVAHLTWDDRATALRAFISNPHAS